MAFRFLTQKYDSCVGKRLIISMMENLKFFHWNNKNRDSRDLDYQTWHLVLIWTLHDQVRYHYSNVTYLFGHYFNIDLVQNRRGFAFKKLLIWWLNYLFSKTPAPPEQHLVAYRATDSWRLWKWASFHLAEVSSSAVDRQLPSKNSCDNKRRNGCWSLPVWYCSLCSCLQCVQMVLVPRRQERRTCGRARNHA